MTEIEKLKQRLKKAVEVFNDMKIQLDQRDEEIRMLKEELQAYKNNEQLEHELSKINKDLETNFNIFD